MTPAAALARERTVEMHYLYPGHLWTGQAQGLVTTILGTCVAVCLWDPKSRAGGVNHYLLAKAPLGEHESPRFGTVAIPKLVEDVLARGARRASLWAKVFGGMQGTVAKQGAMDIGGANVALALELLEKLRIPVLARETGGPRGRKLLFDVEMGNAWVKGL